MNLVQGLTREEELKVGIFIAGHFQAFCIYLTMR